MANNAWGDQLMLVCLARCFNRDITVIGYNSARTFLTKGGEVDGVLPDSVWIAHRAELHYYGVKKVSLGSVYTAEGRDEEDVRSLERFATKAKVRDALFSSLGRTGGVDGECPICTDKFTCAVCSHLQSKQQHRDAVTQGTKRRYTGKQRERGASAEVVVSPSSNIAHSQSKFLHTKKNKGFLKRTRKKLGAGKKSAKESLYSIRFAIPHQPINWKPPMR